MSVKYQPIPYSFDVTIASGSSYSFEESTSLECSIKKPTDELWKAHILYTTGQEPTVLTYEATGIEVSDTPSQFSIFNDGGLLTLKNNTALSIDLVITRIA